HARGVGRRRGGDPPPRRHRRGSRRGEGEVPVLDRSPLTRRVSMAGKGEFEVAREATIPAPRAVVYGLLVDFHHWREWSPWENLDPRLSRTYSGPDAGTGAVYEWVGNRKAGAGP